MPTFLNIQTIIGKKNENKVQNKNLKTRIIEVSMFYNEKKPTVLKNNELSHV